MLTCPTLSDKKGLTEDDPEQYRVMNTLIHNLDLFDASLIVSALSCGLVTGLILTYAIVVKLGLTKLMDTSA